MMVIISGIVIIQYLALIPYLKTEDSHAVSRVFMYMYCNTVPKCYCLLWSFPTVHTYTEYSPPQNEHPSQSQNNAASSCVISQLRRGMDRLIEAISPFDATWLHDVLLAVQIAFAFFIQYHQRHHFDTAVAIPTRKAMHGLNAWLSEKHH